MSANLKMFIILLRQIWTDCADRKGDVMLHYLLSQGMIKPDSCDDISTAGATAIWLQFGGDPTILKEYRRYPNIYESFNSEKSVVKRTPRLLTDFPAESGGI